MCYFLPLSFLFGAENFLAIGTFGGLTLSRMQESASADTQLSTQVRGSTELWFHNWRMRILPKLLMVARTLHTPEMVALHFSVFSMRYVAF